MYGVTFNDPKNLPDKLVTVMSNISEIYGACRHNTTFH